MSITDKLRKEARAIQTFTCMKEQAEQLTAIADRIDAEHESICHDYQREHDDWVYIRDTCWVELPKDADGVPIHIGDVMEFGDVGQVQHLELWDGAWVAVAEYEPGRFTRWSPEACRHHHAPTVEDVLREMLYKAHIYDEREMELLPDLIADYAKRLTLAEGEDA